MIENHIKKYILIEVPDTGCNAIVKTINKQTGNLFCTSNSNLSSVSLKDSIDNYSLYAFYRDPYTRFVSAWQKKLFELEKRFNTVIAQGKLNDNHPFVKEIELFTRNPTLTIKDITPELIKNITIENVIEAGKNFLTKTKYTMYHYQKKYHTSNTILLDYANFETSVRTLLDKIGLDSTVEIEKRYFWDSSSICETVTTNQKKMIVDFFQPDYTYFASRGIYFESNKEH